MGIEATKGVDVPPFFPETSLSIQKHGISLFMA